jgi:hypothetical protein
MSGKPVEMGRWSEREGEVREDWAASEGYDNKAPENKTRGCFVV